jgi:hypothetical protein
VGITLVVVIVIAVVVVVGLIGLIARQRRRPLVRHLRPTSFSRRRAEQLRQAAERDLAALREADEFDRRTRRARRGDLE